MATRAEWIKRVKRWERSGLGAAEFAQREGLKEKQLGWWRWKLQCPEPRPKRAEPPAPPAEPRFLPVRVMTSPPPSPPAASIEVALPNGRVVRVAPGFDPAT